MTIVNIYKQIRIKAWQSLIYYKQIRDRNDEYGNKHANHGYVINKKGVENDKYGYEHDKNG